MEDDPFDLERLRVNPADFQPTGGDQDAAKARHGRRLWARRGRSGLTLPETGGRATLVVAVSSIGARGYRQHHCDIAWCGIGRTGH